MGRFIDETGNKYGSLTVLYKAETPKGKPVKWHCQCDCGKEVDVFGTSLRNGNTKSCGCLQRRRAAESNIVRSGGSILGQKFGKLLVLEEYFLLQKNGKNQRFCKCQCDCGAIVEVSASHLKSGHSQSCGCYNKERSSEVSLVQEKGNRYGKLFVIEEAGRSKEGKVLWKCQCDCGNIKITLGKSLRAGLCQSCGCVRSQGEMKVAKALTELNIQYQQEYTFDNLYLHKGWPLRFDFAILHQDKVIALIECQGEQHYYNIEFFEDETLHLRDKMKKEFCEKNNIPLIEIPYTDYDKIDTEYIRRVMNL